MNRAKRHDHLGMILACTKKRHVGVDVTCHQEAMDEKFLEEMKPNSKAP